MSSLGGDPSDYYGISDNTVVENGTGIHTPVQSGTPLNYSGLVPSTDWAGGMVNDSPSVSVDHEAIKESMREVLREHDEGVMCGVPFWINSQGDVYIHGKLQMAGADDILEHLIKYIDRKKRQHDEETLKRLKNAIQRKVSVEAIDDPF